MSAQKPARWIIKWDTGDEQPYYSGNGHTFPWSERRCEAQIFSTILDARKERRRGPFGAGARVVRLVPKSKAVSP